MKITEIRAKAEILAGLSQKKMPVKLGFAMSCNLDELTKWVQKVEEQRIDICKKHAKKDDKGEPVIVDDKYDVEDMGALAADVAELMNEDIEIQPRKVSSDLLDLIDTSDKYDALTGDEIGALQYMLEG